VTRIEILTIFPELFSGFTSSSLIGKACDKCLLQIDISNIRDFAPPPHYHVDDIPYGGGAGMLFKPEPLSSAIKEAKKHLSKAKILLMSPAGKAFNQSEAEKLSKESELIFVCGRYEGIDDRIRELYIDEAYSIGDYILMGGELPAMVMIEAITRLQSEVIGNNESLVKESFSTASPSPLLEAPHYTRPVEFMGLRVPDVLLCGDPKKIEIWEKEEALKRTKLYRPDLWDKYNKLEQND